MSGFMYILTIIAMSLQYPNGVCMPPPNIVCFFHNHLFQDKFTDLTTPCQKILSKFKIHTITTINR
jgi:hypothetical protein